MEVWIRSSGVSDATAAAVVMGAGVAPAVIPLVGTGAGAAGAGVRIAPFS